MSRPLKPLLALFARPLLPNAVLLPLRPSIQTHLAPGCLTSQRRTKIQYPPRPKPPPESEIKESYLKGSGPGGQKINKTNSAVQLTHIPTGIVVKCQETRSRSQNRKIARNLLATKLDDLRYKPGDSTSTSKAETTADTDADVEEQDVDEEAEADTEVLETGEFLKDEEDKLPGISRSQFIANVKRKKKLSKAKKSRRKHAKAVDGGETEAVDGGETEAVDGGETEAMYFRKTTRSRKMR